MRGVLVYERRANTAVNPPLRINNKLCWEIENGSKRKPNTNKYKLFGWRSQT